MIYMVPDEAAGERLDAWISGAADISRSRAQKLIEEGGILRNGKPADKKDKVAPGDEITVTLPEPSECNAEPEDIPLDVVYEDTDIIVINKPKGMVVHPAPGNEHGTLVNALLWHCRGNLSGVGGVIRPGIVHRIDKDTTGLIVAAKNDAAHIFLSEQLKSHGISREYHALVTGGFSSGSGTVDLPIGRHPTDRKRMAVVDGGRDAVTHYTVLERFGGISYLRLLLETGRTHQIRVHMSHTGHPLLGDTVYGGGKTRFEKLHAPLLCGQTLHAKRLTLTHPCGERMTFECPLPGYFEKLLSILRGE